MNKVITINLNGRAYQLEESGYEALRAYLDEASSKLEGDPGKAEIIADLEQAIAEKCDRLLNPHKTVVSNDEIQKIITEMGPVEGEAKSEAGHSSQKKAQDDAPKRLYRIPEGEMIFGVCNGLAAYFGLDVTLIRIVFVLLAIFTGGAFALAYFVMAMVIPVADTMQDKAAAHGEPFNAEALVQRAKEAWGESYERVTGNKWDDTMQGVSSGLKSAHEEHLKWKLQRKLQKQQWKQQRRTQRHQWHRSNPALGLLRALVAVVWILALISLVRTGFIFGWIIPGVPVWVMLIGLFVVYFAVTGPMKSAQYAPYWSGDPNGNNYSWAYSELDGLVDGLTILFLVIAFVWAYTQVPQVYEFVHHPIVGMDQFVSWVKSW